MAVAIGDVLAIVELVNKIRKDFVDAPDQFKEIAQDVRTLSIVLQDASVNASQLPEDQTSNFETILDGCHSFLKRLEKVVDGGSDVIEHKKGRAVQRLWQRFKFDPDEVRDLRSQLTSKVALLNTFNDQKTSRNIAKIVRRDEDKERRELLEWVSPTDYSAQHNDFVSRHQPGSRRWLFESDEYAQWRSEKGKILFCPGDPGTGKTFTSAIVTSKIQDETKDDPKVLNTYIYCTYQNRDEDIRGLICSLLRNSLQQAPGIPDEILSLYERKRSTKQTLLRDAAIKLLKKLYESFERVNMMVDGLDELPMHVRRPFILELLKVQAHSRANLYVTSRHIPEIEHPFNGQDVLQLEIRASDEDVNRFLQDSLYQLPGFVQRSPDLQAEVIQTITEASSGMFLLAELHLHSLVNKKSPKALRVALSKLSVGSEAYDKAYQDTMTRIAALGSDSEALAKQALLILSCARQPLLTEDLAYALSIEPDSEGIDEDNVPDIEDVVSACAGLVVIDSESNIVRLVHKSTQEYFERNKVLWFPNAGRTMAWLCIQYRSMVESTMGSINHETDYMPPFWRYADSNWAFHVLAAEKEDESATGRAPAPLGDSISWGGTPRASLSIGWFVKEISIDSDATLLKACEKGHHALVDMLLTARKDRDQASVNKDRAFQRPQSPDAFNSDTDDNDLNSSASDSFHSASSQGDSVLMEQLLMIAVERDDYLMVQILLNHGANVNTATNGETPLFAAAKYNFVNMASCLLDQREIDVDRPCVFADKSVINPWHWTPLMVAAHFGHLEVLRVLLGKANCNQRTDKGMSALCIAAKSGQCAVIKELLEHPGVELDPKPGEAEDNDGKWSARYHSPLHVAIRERCLKAFELLIPHSDINRRDHNGRGPLHIAISTTLSLWKPCPHSIPMIQNLLASDGIAIWALGTDGKSPFSIAAEMGRLDIMDMLSAYPGTQLDDQEQGHLWSCASYSALKECKSPENLVDLFSFARFDPNVVLTGDDHLLHQLCTPDFSYYREDICRAEGLWPFLDKDETDEIVREYYTLSVHGRGGGDILRSALDQCPSLDVNIRNRLNATPLIAAAAAGNEFAVAMLLKHRDILPDAEDSSGNTALLAAASPLRTSYHQFSYGGLYVNDNNPQWRERTFEKLWRDPRVNRLHKNQAGESILTLAVRHGTVPMLELILEEKSLTPQFWRVPEEQHLLSLALLNDDECVFEFVLQRSPPEFAHLEDRDGFTPLYHAVNRHRFADVELLLRQYPGIDVTKGVIDAASRYHNPEEMLKLLGVAS